MADDASQNIEPINIVDETRRRYLNYALSVITSRALPDVRDGLKPVQRRILFAMNREGYASDGRTRKCVGVSGEVTKSYHPHGTAPVYDALVRMAQDFVLRYPLVFGEGNFGSVDGDPPAAERYTECKLQPIADELMAELDQDTVDFRPNFDGEKKEPVVLPARFPNLLANGSAGIAVGMATNIPPHNIGELIRACLKLIDDPEVTVANLVSIHSGPIKGPDFPLGGRMIVDQRSLRETYETGQGSIRVQGEWDTEVRKLGKGKEADLVVIRSIPYGVNKGTLLADMGEIIASRKLPMVENMVDESSLDNGMRIVLELKPGTDPEPVMAYLFKHTSLQENFACNFTCLVPAGEDGAATELVPRRLGIKEMLTQFLEFRQKTVRRRYEYILAQLRRRIHILEGFRIIFNDLDRALEIIKKSSGRSDAAARLREGFPELDEEQSFAIVDLNLYRIGQLEMKKIIEELREKKRQAAEIEKILKSETLLWAEVRKELEAFGQKFSDKRRTRLAEESDTPEFDPEAYIVRENTNVVITRDGWIKRVGRLASVASTRVREGDEVFAVVPGSTLDFLIVLTSDGVAYTARIDAVPASSGYGEPIGRLFKIKDGVTIIAAFTSDGRFTPAGRPMDGRKPPFFAKENQWQLLVATAKGRVIRLALEPYLTESTKAGRRYARLGPGDEVVFAEVPTAEHETMLLAASDGHLIHFPIEEVILLSGVGKGVLGMRVADKNRVIGGHLPTGTRDVMRVENTNGIEMRFGGEKFKPTRRGGKGYEVIKRGGLRKQLREEIELVDWNQIAEPASEKGAADKGKG
jgi:DNA gyrase subunit A